jgi:hypothetical protein
MDNVLVAGTAASGIIITGEPAAAGPVSMGGCTYNLGCNTDPLTGGPCGTGLNTDDGFWINVDGDAPHGSTNTGVSCVSAPAPGTTCYWFGGYPGNPFGSFWMVMVADGSCDTIVPSVSNCQINPTASQGCQSGVSTVGLPSATASSAFTVTFTGLNAGVNGTVFYGITGPVNSTWSPQSNLCVKSPSQRLQGVPGASGNTGGTVGLCNGSYSVNFNAIIQGAFPGLLGVPMAAGQRVDVQTWQRDAASVKTTNMSDAVNFTVGP